MRAAKGFFKKNLISVACLLLALVILVSGIISYAKYVMDDDYNGATGIGYFSYSASIDGVSALSFTNTAFWGGSVEGDQSEENLVAMNAIRTVDFSINNFDGDKVNAVRTGYSMTFTVPQIFGDSLALQIMNESGKAMLPQIVISDITSKTAYSTEDCVDYNGEIYVGEVHDKDGNKVDADPVNGNDLYFRVTETMVNGMPAYTATASTPRGNVVVDIKSRMDTKEQVLNFRLWDISKIVASNPAFNSEGGQLLAPLTITIVEEKVFYDITVTIPEFELPAGVKTTNRHTMRIVPTSVLDDTHLGGLIIDKSTGVAADEIYSGQQLDLQCVHENIKIYADAGKTNLLTNVTEPVFGSVKVYNAGNVSTIKTVSPALKENIDPDISDASKAYSATGWTLFQDWKEVSREGTGGNYTANMQRIEERTLVFVVYEKTTVANHIITTQVLSVSDTDAYGHQIDVSLKETTQTTTSVETRPVGTLTVVQRREYTRADTYTGGSLTATGGVTTGDPYAYSQEESVYVPGDVPTTTNTSSPVEKIVYKDIKRSYETVGITTGTVSYTPVNPDGTFGETEYYTSSDPFSIYQDGGVLKKYYVSQCFSKTYPLSVNVTFEQESGK